MISGYLHDDSEVDAERCRISLREKSPITLFTTDSAGSVVCLTGVVQTIRFDRNRAVGKRWRFDMGSATVASIGRRPRTRQRTP
jgi:hypothetical protein